jgi:hypothetical protein
MFKKNSTSAARFGAAAASLALLLATGPLLRAQNYTETGDAGSTPGGAQASGITVNTTGTSGSITGTISGTNDADVYRIQVNAPTLFFATTVNTVTTTSGLDTQLFLFDANGRPVYANDDANGVSLGSTLPAFSSFLANLTPGLYYLAISLSGNNPINTSNQLMFQPGTASTDLRGPAGPLNPDNFSNFDNANTFSKVCAYQINILPEPST